MKLTLITLIVLLITLPLQAQDITNKLGGNTASETYDVTDSDDKLLFRVQGDNKVFLSDKILVSISEYTGNHHLNFNGPNDGRSLYWQDYDSRFLLNGHLEIGGTLYLYPTWTNGDKYIYFENSEYLKWAWSAERFEFSNDLAVGVNNGSNDDNIHFDDGTEYLRWDNSETGFVFSDDLNVEGDVGINTSSPASELHVWANGTDGDSEVRIESFGSDDAKLTLYETTYKRWTIKSEGSDNSLVISDYNDNDGVFILQNTDSWSSWSDRRLKENIVPIENVLESILQIQPIKYNKIGSDTRQIGLIAQEINQFFPEIVAGVESDTTYLGLSYDRLGPILLQAVKELKSDNDKEIQELKDEIAELKTLLLKY